MMQDLRANLQQSRAASRKYSSAEARRLKASVPHGFVSNASCAKFHAAARRTQSLLRRLRGPQPCSVLRAAKLMDQRHATSGNINPWRVHSLKTVSRWICTFGDNARTRSMTAIAMIVPLIGRMKKTSGLPSANRTERRMLSSNMGPRMRSRINAARCVLRTIGVPGGI
jgi:hypothetical protein